MPASVRGKIVNVLGQAALDRLVRVLSFSHRNVLWFEQRMDDGLPMVGLEAVSGSTQTLAWHFQRVDAQTWMLVDVLDSNDNLVLAHGKTLAEVAETAVRAAQDIVLGIDALTVEVTPAV